MTLKNKILAGILSGAMIFTGAMAVNPAQAAPTAQEQQRPERGHHERPQMTEEQANEFAKGIADYYGVNQAEVAAALKNHVHFEDIRKAATLAKLSGKSFTEVLEMKVDWWQVAEKLGITQDQLKEFMKSEHLEELATHSKLDKKTVESLLNEDYAPHDITIAGLIADASGKNVKNVLAKRKINNNWGDVAKEFGVDLQKIMKENFPHPERGEHGKHRK